MTGSEKFLACLFSAVTPRTAGFNTVDTAALTDGSKFLTAVLMFIGGSPGSTAGGIKTTTLMVLLFYVVSNVRQTYGVEAVSYTHLDVYKRQVHHRDPAVRIALRHLVPCNLRGIDGPGDARGQRNVNDILAVF